MKIYGFVNGGDEKCVCASRIGPILFKYSTDRFKTSETKLVLFYVKFGTQEQYSEYLH